MKKMFDEKEYQKEYQKKYREKKRLELSEEDKEAKKLYNKEYRKKNKERIKNYNSSQYEKNLDAIKEYQKEYRQKNKKGVVKKERKFISEKEKKEYFKNYYINNKDKFTTLKDKDYYKDYYKNNKSLILERIKKYRKNNPLYALKQSIRSLIYISLKNKGFKKESKSYEILGCFFEDFKIHLESQFETWMNWDNYGNPKDGIFEPNKTWDLDHIIPLSNAISKDELLELNHFTNIRPLCSYHNRWIKKNNLEDN